MFSSLRARLLTSYVMVILVCVFLGSGIFTVGPQERAIKIRLGKPVGQGEQALLGPGLHWSMPYLWTGCVYGRALTALVLPENTLVSVAAKRTYQEIDD